LAKHHSSYTVYSTHLFIALSFMMESTEKNIIPL